MTHLSQAWLDDAARRKNGLNFQIVLSGILVCLSPIPLIAAFFFPILSAKSFSLFLLGFLMAYGCWPVYWSGIEARAHLLVELGARSIRYVDLDMAARKEAPTFARRLWSLRRERSHVASGA